MKHMLAIPMCAAALVFGSVLPAAAAPKPYSLDTCIISGEKLGSMGKPYVHVHEGQEVKFCCKKCLEDFNKDPKKYLKEIEAKSKK